MKANYYIIFSHKSYEKIAWPESWSNKHKCIANLPSMLREVLNVKNIGSEIKLIWNEKHRWNVINDCNVTYQDLEDYIKSNSSMLSFKTEYLMNRAKKILIKMGMTDMVFVDNYRDVIIKQAEFYRIGHFIMPIDLLNI